MEYSAEFFKQYTKIESSEAVLFNTVFFIHTGNQICGDQKYLISNWKIMKNHINCFLVKIPSYGFFLHGTLSGQDLRSRLAWNSSSQPFVGRDVYFALV